jgi:hypothetical protein
MPKDTNSCLQLQCSEPSVLCAQVLAAFQDKIQPLLDGHEWDDPAASAKLACLFDLLQVSQYASRTCITEDCKDWFNEMRNTAFHQSHYLGQHLPSTERRGGHGKV